jgi:8-oxo-dGTP pyrophosphatase MutT (NUDIX family)
MVDIEASVCRELEEETGLDTATLTRTAGFIVTSAGPIVSIGIEFRSGLAAEALCDRILAHAAQAAEAEIAGVVPVMPEEAGALDSNCVEFIRPLIRHLRGSA